MLTALSEDTRCELEFILIEMTKKPSIDSVNV
jgi:hypothetical protein